MLVNAKKEEEEEEKRSEKEKRRQNEEQKREMVKAVRTEAALFLAEMVRKKRGAAVGAGFALCGALG